MDAKSQDSRNGLNRDLIDTTQAALHSEQPSGNGMSTIRLPTVAGWLFVATIGLLQALPGAAQEAPTVSVSTPEIRTLRTWATFTGRFDAVEHVDIRARVTGYLQSVHFEAGVHVDRGDHRKVVEVVGDLCGSQVSGARRGGSMADLTHWWISTQGRAVLRKTTSSQATTGSIQVEFSLW